HLLDGWLVGVGEHEVALPKGPAHADLSGPAQRARVSTFVDDIRRRYDLHRGHSVVVEDRDLVALTGHQVSEQDDSTVPIDLDTVSGCPISPHHRADVETTDPVAYLVEPGTIDARSLLKVRTVLDLLIQGIVTIRNDEPHEGLERPICDKRNKRRR